MPFTKVAVSLHMKTGKHKLQIIIMWSLALLWQTKPTTGILMHWHKIFTCTFAHTQVFKIHLKYIKVIYVFGSAHAKIGVWITCYSQLSQAWSTAEPIRIQPAPSNWFRCCTCSSHKLNSLNLIWLMWSTCTVSESSLSSNKFPVGQWQSIWIRTSCNKFNFLLEKL